MAVPFTPIDAATITALNGGDERALERILRDHYAVLLERAQERLKSEPAAAPRLVASTIRELWEEREGFHTSAEIEGFLNEELRQRARSARARMAAVHRFEKNEGVAAHAPHAPPTVDQLWTEIATVLHAPGPDRATRRKMLREHAAHEAAEHIAHVAERPKWRVPAIATAIGALGLLAGYLWADKASERSMATQLLASPDAQVVTTRAGQVGSLTLRDGSQARIGADSRLVVVPGFGTDYRTAAATGAVALTVSEGGDRPLDLRVGDVSLTATGGELAVRDFADEMVRFVRASGDGVRVATPTSERALAAGETVAISRDDGRVRVATEGEAAQAFSWLEDQLVLRDVTVGTALQQLWRWYGVDIAARDSAILGRRLSVNVPLASSQAAIAALEGAAQLRFAWEQNKMTFRDAARR
jgi:ferric-dicitrate binding protein FerR (iron transport regulator)